MTKIAPRLLCDAMLGKLARRLRLRGYDTAYLPDTPDIDVMRLAAAEDRLILTLDRGLSVRRGANAFYLTTQNLDEQLEQVIEFVGDPAPPAAPRCSVCNGRLKDLPKSEAKDRVPPYVWRTQESFTHCLGCGRVYWRGTHWKDDSLNK